MGLWGTRWPSRGSVCGLVPTVTRPDLPWPPVVITLTYTCLFALKAQKRERSHQQTAAGQLGTPSVQAMTTWEFSSCTQDVAQRPLRVAEGAEATGD